MGGLQILTRTVFALSVAGLTAPALGADLLPPAPTIELDREEVTELGTGWYLRGDVGYTNYNRPRDVVFSPGPVPLLDGERLEDTFSIGGGIGYQFLNWLRVDATVDHRAGAKFTGTRANPDYAIGYFGERADIESTTLLLNAYLDLGSWSGITPYLGAGIGISGNRITNYVREAFVMPGPAPAGSVLLGPHTSVNLAWALMGGVAVDLGSGFALDVGYRYLHFGDVRTRIDAPGTGTKLNELRAHEARVGVRYLID